MLFRSVLAGHAHRRHGLLDLVDDREIAAPRAPARVDAGLEVLLGVRRDLGLAVLAHVHVSLPGLAQDLVHLGGEFADLDEHASARSDGKIYEVTTLTLLELLQKYDAPKVIDYLSIDTEGSEFDILEAFDFDAYQFRVIT